MPKLQKNVRKYQQLGTQGYEEKIVEGIVLPRPQTCQASQTCTASVNAA